MTSKLKHWQSATALLMTISMGGITLAPTVATILTPAPAIAQTTTFTDVPSNYWAAPFIQQLVSRGVIAGFPDGTFRPNEPVTRAQYAAMLRSAFQQSATRPATNFVDVQANFWARDAIQQAYRMGFLAGYPGNIFRPNQNIPREQVLVSLANGLNLTANQPTNQLLNNYNDAGNISNFAREPIAAATQGNLVVNYPTLRNLNPGRNATRAEVAAMIYQGLVREGRATALNSQYIVALNGQPTQPPAAAQYRIPTGTNLPVSYEQERILLTADETVPLVLTVDANITAGDGAVLIPAGSRVEGQLQPTQGGTQFVAQRIVYADGRTQPINATSQVITQTETVGRGVNVGTLVRNAALGTAAAAAIAAVTGDQTVTTEELLIGGGAGAVFTLIQRFLGRNSVELLVLDTNTDLDLTLRQDLVVSTQQ